MKHWLAWTSLVAVTALIGVAVALNHGRGPRPLPAGRLVDSSAVSVPVGVIGFIVLAVAMAASLGLRQHRARARTGGRTHHRAHHSSQRGERD